MPSASAGASDSIPSTGIPREIFSNMAPRFGNSCIISRALEATDGVMISSLAGNKVSDSSFTFEDL